MRVYNLILNRRSTRRFVDKAVPMELLIKCINAARFAPSGANLQPWEFIIVTDKHLLQEVFDALKWAVYEGTEGTPPEENRSRAYIVVLVNKEIRMEGYEYDVGLAIGNIILTALAEGVASCCIGSINKKKLRRVLRIPEKYIVSMVVAMGYPNENHVVEAFEDSIKYWRDDKGTVHIPKRRLRDILHHQIFGKKILTVKFYP